MSSSILALALRRTTTTTATRATTSSWNHLHRWMATTPQRPTPFRNQEGERRTDNGGDDDGDGPTKTRKPRHPNGRNGINGRRPTPKSSSGGGAGGGTQLVKELRGILSNNDSNSNHKPNNRDDHNNRPRRPLPTPPSSLFQTGDGGGKPGFRHQQRYNNRDRYNYNNNNNRDRYNSNNSNNRDRYDGGYDRGGRRGHNNGNNYGSYSNNNFRYQHEHDNSNNSNNNGSVQPSFQPGGNNNNNNNRGNGGVFHGLERPSPQPSSSSPPPTVNLQFGVRDAAAQRVARGADQQQGKKNAHRSLRELGPIADWVRTPPSSSEDIFQIPAPPPPSTTPSEEEDDDDTVEKSPYDSYWELADQHTDVTVNKRWADAHKKKKSVSPEQAESVETYLKQEEIAVPLQYEVPSNDATMQKEELLQVLDTQKTKFMSDMNFDDKQYELTAKALFIICNMSAKKNAPETVTVLWQKVKEAGIAGKDILRQLLHLGGSLSIANQRAKRELSYQSSYEGGSGSAILDMLDGGLEKKKKPDDEEDEEEDEEGARIASLVDEIATYYDALHEHTEQTIQTRVRMMVSRGKAMEADALLRKLGHTADYHLRVFTPVIRLHIEQENASQVLSLYDYMKNFPTVHFDSDFYIQLLAGLSENGCFRQDAPPIEGADSLGFSHSSGPGLFGELVDEMEEKIIEISQTNAKRLYNALAKGMEAELRPLGPLEVLKLENSEAARDHKVVASRVQIDHETGHCPRTGVDLQLKQLTEEQREKLIVGCRELALEAQNKWTQHQNPEKADEAIDRFLAWMDQREGEPYTAIVDGANVAYYMQNFDDGGFNLHQIKFVVDALETMGENPLVILPAKYGNDRFMVSGGGDGVSKRKQYTNAEKQIRRELQEKERVYFVPPGLLDDYYWICGSVAKQSVSSRGEDLSVPTDDPKRWPGARPVLISNDQMRDHKLGMLEPMGFRRWYSNFIVNYNFGAFVGAKKFHNDIGFSTADFFSREIQVAHGENGESVWHFPVESSRADEWFCVRFGSKGPKKEESESNS